MTGNAPVSKPRRRRKDREAPSVAGDLRHALDHVAIEPTHEEIARRAYQLFEERGGGHGHDQQDWFQAERELRDSVRDAIGQVLVTEGAYAAV